MIDIDPTREEVSFHDELSNKFCCHMCVVSSSLKAEEDVSRSPCAPELSLLHLSKAGPEFGKISGC